MYNISVSCASGSILNSFATFHFIYEEWKTLPPPPSSCQPPRPHTSTTSTSYIYIFRHLIIITNVLLAGDGNGADDGGADADVVPPTCINKQNAQCRECIKYLSTPPTHLRILVRTYKYKTCLSSPRPSPVSLPLPYTHPGVVIQCQLEWVEFWFLHWHRKHVCQSLVSAFSRKSKLKYVFKPYSLGWCERRRVNSFFCHEWIKC